MSEFEEDGLGRLVRTTNERCPYCETALQIRARKVNQLIDGETVEIEDKYRYCHICDIDFNLEAKERDWRKDHAKNKQRERSEKINSGKNRKGFGKSYR